MVWRRGTWPALAIVVLLAALASDFFVASYWATHPMLTAIVSAMAVVLVSVAVIDAVLERRDERRWRLLAQYALVDLVLGAHTVWVRLASEVEVSQAENLRPDQIQQILRSDRAPAIRRSVADSLDDGARREKLHRALEELSQAGRQRLTDWAAVMTGSKTYAELFDQHVELYGQVHTAEDYLRFGDWEGVRYDSQLGPVSHNSPPRWTRAFRPGLQSKPGEVLRDRQLFIDSVLSVINQAADLQNQTWTLALRVVPAEWWLRRIDERVAATHSNGGRHDSPDDA